MSKLPTIERGVVNGFGRLGCRVRFPFDEDVIAELKAKLAPADRTFGDSTKTWWVAKDAEATAVKILAARFGEVMVIDDKAGDFIVDKHGNASQQHRMFE